MLGSIIYGNCKDLNNPYALKTLGCSLVRPVRIRLQLCHLISTRQVKPLKQYKINFLRLTTFKSNIFRKQHSYEPPLSFLSQESLSTRWVRLDLCFIYKLLHGSIHNIVQNYYIKLISLFVTVEPDNYTFFMCHLNVLNTANMLR